MAVSQGAVRAFLWFVDPVGLSTGVVAPTTCCSDYLIFNYMSVFPFGTRIWPEVFPFGQIQAFEVFPFGTGKLPRITFACAKLRGN